MKKTNNLFVKISVAVTYVAMIAINALANIIPFNGMTTGQISNLYPNLFAPAALTFSVWGLIYLLLGAYTLYQLGLFQKDKGKGKVELFNRIGIYFIITSLANAAWIFSWHYNIISLSVLLIIVILFFLIKIVRVLNQETFSFKEKVFISLPFSVYFGWITIATIANIVVFLVSIGWDGFGVSKQIWTVVLLLTGMAIGLIQMIKNRDIAYGLVLIWAYIGILIKHLSSAGFNGQYSGVITTTVVCLSLFLISLLLISQKGKEI